MKLLAIETSTDTMSLGVQNGEAIFLHTGAGGAAASSSLIPAIEALMRQADLQYAQLDLVVFGHGPGSFTGLRTACSVAQGLAFGANIKVLPVDTLMAVAQEARMLLAETAGHNAAAGSHGILAALDARMGEVYINYYDFNSALRTFYNGHRLKKPQEMQLDSAVTPGLLAGNIRPAMDALLSDAVKALPYQNALPSARALLSLAPALLAAGGAVDAELALPLYVRDKVALTTAERQAHNAQ
jgi:tRNA threonylcarbamoyladenosine biosynthesis protein TsaB